MPRVVQAGVPSRTPLGRRGGRGSSGMICLLVVMPMRSSASSAARPSRPKLATVSITMQMIVGAAGDQLHALANSAAASALALRRMACA